MEPEQQSLFTGGRIGPDERPGRFYGHDATATERASGEAVEERDAGQLKSGTVGHRYLLLGFGDGAPRTAYEASALMCGHHHRHRRETGRLVTRGYLHKIGERPNEYEPPHKNVDLFQITDNGRAALVRLGSLPD